MIFKYKGFSFEVTKAPNGMYHSRNTHNISGIWGYGNTDQGAVQMSKEKTDALFEPTTSIEELAQKIKDTASIPDYEEFEILPEVLAILLGSYRPR